MPGIVLLLDECLLLHLQQEPTPRPLTRSHSRISIPELQSPALITPPSADTSLSPPTATPGSTQPDVTAPRDSGATAADRPSLDTTYLLRHHASALRALAREPPTPEGWERAMEIWGVVTTAFKLPPTTGPSQLCPILLAILEAHFTTTWAQRSANSSILLARTPAADEVNLDPFTAEEVAWRLKRSENTAPGEDRLTYQHWKSVDPEGRFLSAFFNVCLRHHHAPDSWRTSRTILLFKKGDVTDPRNWRPIALGNTAAKLYAKCLAGRLQDWLKEHYVLSHCQKGFLPHDGVFEHNYVIQDRLDEARDGHENICVAFLDFSNAYGSVPHQALLDALRETGARDRFIELVADLSNSTRIVAADALASESGLALNPNKCRSLHLSGAHPVGTRPSIFKDAGAAIPAMADFDSQKFLGRPVGFRVLADDINIIDHAIQRGTALLSSLLAPWQRHDAIRTFVYPGFNFMMRCGTLGKDDWQRLDDALRPLLKRTLYLPSNASNENLYGSPRSGAAAIPLAAELSDLCRVDNAFKLLTSADFEVRDMASHGLFVVVSKRLRRPAEQRDVEDYLSGSTEGDFRAPASQLRSAWTEARKASRRLDVLWQLDREGVRITCGDKTLTSSHRRKVIRTLRAIQSATRDDALHCKPNQGKVMECVAADPASSHFMHTGSFTRFADWRFIHKARLNVLPLNGASPWMTGRDQRCTFCTDFIYTW
ncbi:uncharacterized protein [Dermacentor andersoni]|uniref:uncharacterized protein n=1 Tax=Dermacentor andersoni TaxID=34620 RepID=UPI003B3A6F69